MNLSRRTILAGGLAAAAAGRSSWALAGAFDPPPVLTPGSGRFWLPGGPGRESRPIEIVYHRPANFTPASPILLVLPGGGRRAGLYRDTWARHAERRGVLVAALRYPTEHYDFAAYQLGGLVKNLRVLGRPLRDDVDLPKRAKLDDADVTWEVEPRREAWIFGDFDRVFAELVRATGSERTGYDVFGHSGGAQVAHRFAMFQPGSRAERIVAANAGLYTLPTPSAPLIYGLAGAPMDRSDLAAALKSPLTILLGAEDNDPNHGDAHLHTPTADRQGRARLTRGRNFFRIARMVAQRAGLPMNWSLEVIPGVGHDHRRMARIAAERLYG